MSKCYWLSIAILFWVGLFAYHTAHAQSRSEIAQAQSALPAQTLPALQNSLDRIGSALEVANNKSESADAERRAERDVKAQTTMAHAAKVMIYVGIVEILITGAGVFLVYRTLRATWAAKNEAKRAADAARDTVNSMEETAKRQLRAYVVIDEVSREDPNRWPPQFVMTIKNAGQTPAHKVSVRTGETISGSEPAIESINIRVMAEYEIPLGPIQSSEHILFAGDFKKICAGISYDDFVQGKSPNLYIAGIVEYEDIYGAPRATKFHFSYGSTDLPNGNVTFCRNGNEAT